MTGDTGEMSGQAKLYYDRVIAALADVASDVRQDLVEDLPGHLAEVACEIAAEGGGSLRDRLGEPEAYALELRAAAGLATGTMATGTMATGTMATDLAQRLRRASELADRLDLRAGQLVGYPRLLELLRALRPGWWVLRGWLLAELLAGTHDRASWSGFVPDLSGNRLLGLFVTLALIAASVAFGRRSLGLAAWARRTVAGAGALLALWGIGVLASNVGGTAYAYSGADQGYTQPLSDVTDVYVYDQAGRLVDGARLFDQNGNLLQLGTGYCADGQQQAFDPVAGSWSYPLCPTDPGPFRSGPGPLTPSTSAPERPSALPASSAPSTPSSQRPTVMPSGSRPSPTATPTPTPTATAR
jgi:hypothetical protein